MSKYSFRPRETRRVVVTFSKPSLTKISEQDACDINRIVAKFVKTGLYDHVSNKTLSFGDATQFTDYQSALDVVMTAQDTFNAMPLAIRKRFDYRPEDFVRFLSDPLNRDEAISLGLVKSPMPPSSDPPTPIKQVDDKKST